MLGVYIHSIAGEFAAIELTPYSMTASDILYHFPEGFLFYDSASMIMKTSFTLEEPMDWKPLTLECKQLVTDALKRNPIGLSDHVFANLWMWHSYRNYEIAEIDKSLCLRFKEDEESIYLYPIGGDHRRKVIEKIANENSPLRMRAIPESALKELEGFKYPLTEDVDHFDYIYSFEKLAELKGNALQSKRNLLNQFTSTYDYKYVDITTDLLPKLMELELIWFDEHPNPSEWLMHEHESCMRALSFFEALELQGGAIEVEGKLIAYSIAEYMNDQMLLIHIEKALHGYKGDYQAINNELLKHMKPVPLVNREEDLGFVNLAKGKSSYRPLFKAKKYYFEAPKVAKA
jgi:hypothetical protein